MRSAHRLDIRTHSRYNDLYSHSLHNNYHPLGVSIGLSDPLSLSYYARDCPAGAPASAPLPVSHDGLSPFLIPAPDPSPHAHACSSPRQRTGFPRSTPCPSAPPSPTLSDCGAASDAPSPALPVLSPHASAALRHPLAGSPRRTRTRLSLPRAARAAGSQATYLALYFLANLALTLYNKLVLASFPFPYTLTALHALCGALGGAYLRREGAYVPKKLGRPEWAVLWLFSVLYAVNIAVSNVSLGMVTVPFHQVVRAATPIFTTALSMALFGTRYSRLKIASLAPVMAGVALATYGDYYFTLPGLLLTLLGTLLAALKTIYTNVLQSSPPLTSTRTRAARALALALPPWLPARTVQVPLPVPPRLALHPLDLLARTSPLACALCALYAYASGELAGARAALAPQAQGHVALARVLVLLGNGALAFVLNVVSLSANKRVGALNMTVAANVKQALTILIAVVLFRLTITPMNAAGICITLAGGAWYAWVEYQAKAQRHTKQDRNYGKPELTATRAA